MNIFKNYDLDNLERNTVKEVAELSRKAAAEGCVLLKNDGVLPFDNRKTLSIFGRTQIDYVKCGIGSGGMVNTEYTVNILDGLSGRIQINQQILEMYKAWIDEHPFDKGPGWSSGVWYQKEMPVSDELCKIAAENSDYALVIIGRNAGEDKENMAVPESYLLTETEEELIKTVCKHFDKVCVALNVGNIIDMKWVEKYNVPCVLYCWQGGQEGGNAFADVVLGEVSPSGRLSDTIAYDIADYPSTKNHGDPEKNIYQEDIYVGYRYFESFCKDKVLYPFGYGLSYTSFECNYNATTEKDTVKITATVKNMGSCAGKTVIQVYYSAPQGKLGKPDRQLVRYAKTRKLESGDEQVLHLEFPVDEMASYDDMSTFSYVLEKGKYGIYVGENVRDAMEVLTLDLQEKTVKTYRQALAPVESFERMKRDSDGKLTGENVLTGQYDISERIKEHLTDDAPEQGEKIMLQQVADGEKNLDEFIMGLSDTALTCLVKGEGMNSPRVTGGTGSAFGGVSDELISYGIPAVCCSDGPSGIRMDTGDKATLIPNGTCLAASWNDELVEEIYAYLGIELRANEIDILLAPGMNIHRNPLNGRNFEYFSEDPYLTGRIAGACTRGLASAGVAGSIKHFACNSQEHRRHMVDSVVSERALREIYLKPFEIAIKEGEATVVMTSYNAVNGEHSSSNYDLATTILREEWGFDGLVITDWWTNMGPAGIEDMTNLSAMVKSQNDIYMVTQCAAEYNDNLIDDLKSGELSRTYLRKCAKNILKFILTSPAFGRKTKIVDDIKLEQYVKCNHIENIKSGDTLAVEDAEVLELAYAIDDSELSQNSINVYSEQLHCASLTLQGTNSEERTALVKLKDHTKPLKIVFSGAFKHINLTVYKKKA